jgi:hypothetical protein
MIKAEIHLATSKCDFTTQLLLQSLNNNGSKAYQGETMGDYLWYLSQIRL